MTYKERRCLKFLEIIFGEIMWREDGPGPGDALFKRK
jgi:hypothetical protein